MSMRQVRAGVKVAGPDLRTAGPFVSVRWWVRPAVGPAGIEDRATRAWAPNARDAVVPASAPNAPRTRPLYTLRVAAVMSLSLVCLGWTVWLIFLTASPTATVNRLMDTSDLDFGSFWRLSESPESVVSVGLVGLTCVATGYVFVLHRIVVGVTLRWKRHRILRDLVVAVGSRISSASHQTPTNPGHQAQGCVGKVRYRVAQAAREVHNAESSTRRIMNVLIKLVDLVIQCVYLVHVMEEGMPIALISVFAATVTLNALCTAAQVVQQHNMGRTQLLLDTAFDVTVALAFPVLVLAYAFKSFTFDKTLMAINDEVFPEAGLFERMASLVADPVQVTTARRTFDLLRIDSIAKLFMRVGTSATLLHRVYGLSKLLRVYHTGPSAFPNVYPKRQHAIAAFFVAIAIIVVVFTTGSVLTSSAACEMHPECVQIARRWVSRRSADDPTRCPCLAMIDRNIAIAKYDEWEFPVDRTEKLAQLAAPGRLQTVQLVNRALPSLPDELRRCRQLKHVSLLYTEKATLPDWFAEFTRLEFLHVEGKTGSPGVKALPDHLFDHMHKLTFVHLAVQPISRLPSFNGLTNLRWLSLGGLLFLTELPSLDRLENLERLTVGGLPGLDVFPDLTHVRALQSLITVDRGAFCCNGFLGPDKCDLGRSLCQKHFLGFPAITQCLPSDRVASLATRAYFNKFASTACSGEAARRGEIKVVLTREDVEQCNGTMFRACEASDAPPGTPAMCYNSRWMAIACEPSPFPMEMRRRQIAMGRGVPCDPQVEAWLGCTKKR